RGALPDAQAARAGAGRRQADARAGVADAHPACVVRARREGRVLAMIAVHKDPRSQRRNNKEHSPMATLTLYHAVPSRSMVTRWMLEEVGEPYDVHLLNLANGENRTADHLAINPMGKVPALRH